MRASIDIAATSARSRRSASANDLATLITRSITSAVSPDEPLQAKSRGWLDAPAPSASMVSWPWHPGAAVDERHSEPGGERPIRRAAPDVDRRREIEVVGASEHDAHPGYRLPAPAQRRARRVRA